MLKTCTYKHTGGCSPWRHHILLGKNLNDEKEKRKTRVLRKKNKKRKKKKQYAVWVDSLFVDTSTRMLLQSQRLTKWHQRCYNHIVSKGHEHVIAAGVWIPFDTIRRCQFLRYRTDNHTSMIDWKFFKLWHNLCTTIITQ